ncbi:DUF2397 family protein [Streptomyces albulus]|nr:DUF2397 family protein [Streptomyces noursei]
MAGEPSGALGGLRAWFLPDDGTHPRIEQLHDIARRAIVSLLQVLERINESRRRSSSAVQDFRELARWFAAASEEDDLHRLWSAAFGLGSARHAHLAHPDPELIPRPGPGPRRRRWRCRRCCGPADGRSASPGPAK